MRKFTQSLCALAVAFVATCSAVAQTVVTSLDQLSDSKAYTLAAQRAALDASTNQLTNATADATSTAQQFAIHKYNESTYVVYSVSKSQFLTKSNNKGVFTNYPTTEFTLAAATMEGRWIFKNLSTNTRINIGNANDLFIDGWSTDDTGNQFEITEVGDLDEATQTNIEKAIEKEKNNNAFTNQITSLDQLSNNKAYYVFNARGAWAYSAEDNADKLTSTSNTAEHYLNDNLKAFALLKSARGNYYAYNVAAKKFVGITERGTQVTDAPTLAGEILEASEGRKAVGTPWVFAINTKQINITPGQKEQGGIISFWNDTNDEGNAVGFMEAGDFDATDALAAINSFEAENDFVTDEILPRSGYTFSQFPEVSITFTGNVHYNGGIVVKKDGEALPEGVNVNVNCDEEEATITLTKTEGEGDAAKKVAVTDEGVYTIHIPASALISDEGLFLEKDIDLTYTLNAAGPAEAFNAVSITPTELLSDDYKFSEFPVITLTFNRDVKISSDKKIEVLSQISGTVKGAEVTARVDESDPKSVVLTTTGVTKSGTYLLNIPEDFFTDEYGQGNDENSDIQVTLATPANVLTPISISPSEDEPVKILTQIVLTFGEDLGLVREDKIDDITITNEKTHAEIGNAIESVEYPMDYEGEFNSTHIVISLKGINQDGTYTITLPEGLIYNSLADDSEDDYGVELGATYNPEITFKVTVDTTTGIATVKGETKDGKAIYNLNGVKVNKATKGVFIINGKKAIVK